ncbi:MAG TPA: hypothetical protein VM098_05075 [Phycisphaerae bacterium]|nr:hypothetical protein [Phycisphaerae bacterium]
MARLARCFVCLAVLGGLTASLCADAISEQKAAQNKLMAQRAARADAMRKLGERIKGLAITSETTVKDFVVESDTINTAMAAFLAGMRETSVKHLEDGTCQVKMEVTLVDIIVSLKQIHKAYYKGSRFKIQDFEQITVSNTEKVIAVTGNGAIPVALADAEGAELTAEAEAESPEYLKGAAKAYWMSRCTGQGRLMAVLAARMDAQRRLAERIKGVFITSETTVQDFVAESDQIDVKMATFLRGAREKRIRYHADELIVEMDMEVTLRTVYESLKVWSAAHYKGDKANIQHIEELARRSETTIIKETGMGIPGRQYLKTGITAVELAVIGTAGKTPNGATGKLKATGYAAVDVENENKAQAKLMAIRGAELDARRKLAERITGLMITSSTSVRDFVAENDEINTSMLTFQQGVYVVEGSQKVLDDDTATATVEIDLKPLWNMVIYYQRKLSITIK